MQLLYPSEIKDNARSFGYKAANLIFLESCIVNFNVSKTNSIRSTIPKFKAIPNNEIIKHLINNIPDFVRKWKNFCDLQRGQSETLTSEAKSVLKSLREEIERVFTDIPFTLTDLPNSTKFMVRSTGEEDRVDVANPGGNESIASDVANISRSIGLVVASYLSEKSLMQRLKSGEDITDHFPLSPCLIQEMVEGKSSNEPAVSGVIYTDNGHVRIQSAPGHGELIVNSRGNFDNYYITPQGKVYAEIRYKHVRLTPKMNKLSGKAEQIGQDNDFVQATNPSLDEQVAIYIHNLAKFIERTYGMRMDIEFVYDKSSNTVNVVQARPIPEGDRRGLRPSALSNEFISRNNPYNLRSSVITPDINSASVINEPEEVLICDTIEEALNTYLEGSNKIKAIIIKNEAPDTSHEAGMFTSKAIPVLQIENIDEAKQLAASLKNNVLIIDPQHKKIYKISLSQYSPEIIWEGIYASTLSPYVTPLKRTFNESEEALFKELFSIMKTTRVTKYTGKLLNEHLDNLSIPKFGEEVESQQNIIANLLQFNTRMIQKRQISADLFKEIMLTGRELHKLLLSMKTEGYNEEKSKYYLNVFEKFMGLLVSQKKKDVLSSSLIQELSTIKDKESYIELVEENERATSLFQVVEDFFGHYEKNADIFNSLTANQREIFLELVKLDKFIINPQNKAKWRRFCLQSCQSNQESILKELVKDIVKHEVHVSFLNTIFCSEYIKNPQTALQNLFNIFKAGEEDREKLSKAAKILRSMESQLKEWSAPGNFSYFRENLHRNLDLLQELLKFDNLENLEKDLKDPINGNIVINYLYKLVDIFDLSIKQVQINKLYSQEQKVDQVRNFCDLIHDFYDLMRKFKFSSIEEKGEFFEYIKKGKLEPSQLDLSPTFSINRENMIYSLTQLMSPKARAASLADIHSLIHQIMIQSISDLNASIPIDKILINDSLPLITKLQKHFVSKKTFLGFMRTGQLPTPELMSTNIKYPGIYKVRYNIPLAEHSGALDLQFDWNTGEYNIKYTLYGINVLSRWEVICRYGVLLINTAAKNSIVTRKEYDSGQFNISESVVLEVKTKEFTDAITILEICNSLSKATFTHSASLIGSFNPGQLYNIFVGKEFEKLAKDKFDSTINTEVKKQIKEWYTQGLIPIEEITNKRILKLARLVKLDMFPKISQFSENTLTNLIACKDEVFDFITSPKPRQLFKYGVTVDDVLLRKKTEDSRGFTTEEKKILISMGLFSNIENNTKIELLDKLIEESQKNSSKQLSDLILKIVKRSIEDIILANDKEMLPQIVNMINKIPGIIGRSAYDYFINLAMHGHEEILVEYISARSYPVYLTHAIENGELLKISTLLNIGTQIFENNNVDSKEGSFLDIISKALSHAARCNQAKVVKMLLEVGADTDAAASSVYKTIDKEIIRLLKKYTHNPVDYLLEAHQDNPVAFLKAIKNLKQLGYDFTSHDSPDRTWDLDAEKITRFLDQGVAGGRTTNFRKIIKSGDRDAFELALSFKPDIKDKELELITSFFKEFSLDQFIINQRQKPMSWRQRVTEGNSHVRTR